MTRKKKLSRWLSLTALLLACLCLPSHAQEVDDLQDYLDYLAQKQPALAPRLSANKALDVSIPIGLPVVDLSQFASYQQRTKVLTVNTSVKFVNGIISSSASRNENGPLLKIMDGATVVVASSAGVSAAASSQGSCANNTGLTQTVGIYGGSTFYQECDIVAPGAQETNEAIHLATAADSYYHTSGTRIGIIHNPNGGTVVENSMSEWTIGTGGDFASVNAAMTDSRVKAGHTLRLLPGTHLTGTQTIVGTKPVTLLGNGFMMNSTGQLADNVATISTLEVKAVGTVVKDLAFLADRSVKLYANEVTVEGCSMNELWAYSSLDTDNITVRKNFIQSGIAGNDSYEWTVQNNIILNGLTGLSESLIDHNIIYIDWPSSQNGNCIDELFSCTVSNNIITHFQSDQSYAGTFSGLFFSGTLSEGADNTFTRNVFTGTMSLSNNKGNVTQESQLFAGGYRYTDAFFKLVANSPAKGYATDGTDCGPWSGSDPYISQTEISDFQVEENDLLALKNMYDNLGGIGWTSKKWSFANNGMLESDFPGVTFDGNGRVTAINLSDNGLAGSCYEIPATHFTELKTLNLSRNSIAGDLGLLVGNLKKLSTLNMDHNRLTHVSKALTIIPGSASVKYQNRVYQSSSPEQADFTSNVSSIGSTSITLGSNMTVNLPSLMSYSFISRNFNERPTLRLCQTSTPNVAVAMLLPASNGSYYQLQFSGVYSESQAKRMMLIDTNGTWSQWSAYPATVRYVVGDANMSGETNVLDVQYTLRYILAPSALTYFNYSAANTYYDNTINVQDCVVTVNIVLGNGLAPANSRSDSPTGIVPEGGVWMEGGRLMLSADRDVAAIDVELQGVSTDEVALMLNRSDFQMAGRDTEWGSRYVIFSPTGKRIAAGDVVQLLRVSGQAQPVAIQCADPDAQEVAMAVGTMPSGISEVKVSSDAGNTNLYDLQGRRTDGSRKGVYVQHGKKVIVR